MKEYYTDTLERARDYLIDVVRRQNRKFIEATRSYIVSLHKYQKSYVTNTFASNTNAVNSQKYKIAAKTNNSKSPNHKIVANTNNSNFQKHKIEENTHFELTFSVEEARTTTIHGYSTRYRCWGGIIFQKDERR